MSDKVKAILKRQLDDGLWGVKDAAGNKIGEVSIETNHSPPLELWELYVSLSEIAPPSGVSVYDRKKPAPETISKRLGVLQAGNGGSNVKWYSLSKDTPTGTPSANMLPAVLGTLREAKQGGTHVGWVFHEGTSNGTYKTHHFMDGNAFDPTADLTYDTTHTHEDLQDSAKNGGWYKTSAYYFVTEFDWKQH